MTYKTIGEIFKGDWLQVSHLPYKTMPRHEFRSRYFRNFRNTNMDKECTAEVYSLDRTYGHTYILRYKCLCNRYFEERVRVSTLFGVKTEQEVMMDSLYK